MQPDRGPVFHTLNGTGLFLALVMLWVALSPSLLPRPVLATGVTVGLSMAFGYAVGKGVQSLWVRFSRAVGLDVSLRDPWAARLRYLWFGLLGLVTLGNFVANARRQGQLEAMTLRDGAGALGQLVGTGLGIVVFLVILGIARGIGWATRFVRRRLARYFPAWLASLTALVVVGIVVAWIADGVVVRPILERASQAAEKVNSEPAPDLRPPTEATRSGSPESGESWDSLGAQGQRMVSEGPRADDIERVTGRDAIEPIRVYAGLRPDQDIAATVQGVMAELDRTHAWDRSVLLLVTSAGKGYVQEWSVAATEYLTQGDCASASMQYSYLDSGWAYVVDRDSPVEAGKALYDAVHAKLATLPPDHRPRLILNGESLGSYGGQGAFDNPQQMIDGVDGAVWVGTPRFTPMWRQLTASRQIGSPEVAPVIDNGRTIRFINSPDQLTRNLFGGPYDTWGSTRIVYLQHASDPVVWWSPELLWREPDWMREGFGTDVVKSLTWMPWVTFWQLATDMPASATGPGGHGHQYHEELVPVMNAVLDAGRGQAELGRITSAIRDA